MLHAQFGANWSNHLGGVPKSRLATFCVLAFKKWVWSIPGLDGCGLLMTIQRMNIRFINVRQSIWEL